MKRRTRPSSLFRSSLHVEPLEPRCLLAGNVLADVLAGNLRIMGDGADNGIQITPTAVVGEYVVEGTDRSGPTTVNGKPLETLRGVSGDFRIRLEGGADRAAVKDCSALNNVVIQTAPGLAGSRGLDGSDEVVLHNSAVRDGLTCRTGSGDDTVYVTQVHVTGAMRIETQSDLAGVSDTDRIACEDLLADGVVSLRSGAGDDAVRINGCTFGHSLSVDAGYGADDVHAEGSTVRRDMALLTHAGDDELMLIDLSVGGAVVISTDTYGERSGTDADEVIVDRLTCTAMLIDAGRQADEVLIRDSTFHKSLFAALGAGDDQLTIERLAGGWAVFDGGPGGDRYIDLGGHSFHALTRWRFELFGPLPL